jgi:hypothetical protein
VSESGGNPSARKPIGKPSEGACRDTADKWSGRFAEWYQAKDTLTPLRALPEVCRNVAESLAGRPVEVVWCSTWGGVRLDRFAPDPSPDIWRALDASPLEGIGAKDTPRERLLREVFERRLAKDRDQTQVKADLESLGFSCGVWNAKGERDPVVTSTTPIFACTAGVGEVVGAPSRPLLLFGLEIRVTLKFAETGEPRGWQQIEVRTGEAHQ